MAGKNSAAPVIIKRKKIVGGDGHHGGAWKVAYADFVTAMMAFFLLMWLLGATTEEQRKGVADYFAPTASISPSGGGVDVLGGDSPFSQDARARSGTGLAGGRSPSETGEGGAGELHEIKTEIDKHLTAFSGESMTMQRALRHVVTRVTDEGLVIEIFDLDHAALFAPDSARPEPVLREIATMLAEVLDITSNELAVNGHVRSYPMALARNPIWELSAARADALRGLLQSAGVPASRLRRITGHADRKPVTADPMANRNNRVEVVLLRRDR
ncbi:chemotaxis protein MotB [Gemmobacter caeni]|uniref:Chemotaxis protein MotB n=1 Tax=Gemmobacter caeni TaxID=589035 RepID=A0A2T6AUN8_9RHOB|nr:flagellar motor protein MotB [Gemmobacter caeni]PTX47528.1 chemotaxis protein MotB [Gemmobacter caeni]TWI97719.1 chemotaxis protein MotB [Gemmobacter caeni]